MCVVAPHPEAPTGRGVTDLHVDEDVPWDQLLTEGLNPDAPLPATFGPTEDGMARALVAHFGHELRFCPQRGRWLHWDGHRWRWDEGEFHRERIRQLARILPESTREWRMFHRRALSAAGVTGIARLAQSDPKVIAHFDTLDADPWLLNTPNGPIDLRTGELSKPDPAKLVTRSSLCPADDSADAAAWEAFLADTFGDDPEMIAYLQRLVGYSAVGMVGPHVLPFAFGSGGNGKGVFLEALAGALGDYATTAPVGFLMAQQHAGHETEIARLAGARMVICSEVNEDDHFDEAKVKMLTGGDTLTARFMRQDHFTFTPSHQLWLMGNHKPAVKSGGRSFWRRLRLIPFVHEVPEDKVVEDLQGILVREHGPALLAWVVAGAVSYAVTGLDDPATVTAATKEYATDQDNVQRFVADCCHTNMGQHAKTAISVVREEYERWCHTEDEEPVSSKRLTQELARKFNVGQHRNGRTRHYTNLVLSSDREPPDGDR
jgi:putative DNA primase/helicase